MSTERVIVQRSVSDKLIALVKQISSEIKAGHYTDFPKAQLSALFSTASAENVVNMVKEAQAAGAQVVLGDIKRDGNVVQPHIISSVKPGMRIWDKESFGPGTSYKDSITAGTHHRLTSLSSADVCCRGLR